MYTKLITSEAPDNLYKRDAYFVSKGYTFVSISSGKSN